MATATVPIRTSRYWPHVPHVKQAAFLSLHHREALYGGAAGGGKSEALLMAALQYVDVPGYAALLLRRTFRDLNQPGALIPRSKEWLSGTGAKWNDNDSRWTFPSGATLTFGYLAHEDDKLQYQGAEYHFVGWDELTQFTETQYRYVSFSRGRRTVDLNVPIRVRAASNPGGPGHDWVKQRFGLYREQGEPPASPYVCHRATWTHPGRVFIPAKVRDNPSLDADEYLGSLEELDHHTRRQLSEGDWDSAPPGDLFRRGWFEIVDVIPPGCKWIRYWDQAATEPSDANPDPDYSVGLRMGKHPNGTLYVEDVVRDRLRPKGVETLAKTAAERDGPGTAVWLEEEPGSSGKAVVSHWIEDVLPDRAVKGLRSTGSKFDRASVVSSKAEHGLIKLKRAAWNTAFLDELEAFTATDEHAHDDQVDGLSGAYQAHGGTAEVRTESYMESYTPPRRVRGDLELVGEQYIDLP
jgi:predicted phage terminase large subunit-like protein